MIEDVSKHLEAIFIAGCPDAKVTECGLFNRKTELRLSCEWPDGSNRNFFARNRLLEVVDAERLVREWAIKANDLHQRKAS
jgi:hypothetical protein